MFRVPLRRTRLFWLVLGALLLVGPAGAQSVAQAGETRATLTAQARTADSLGRHEDAFRIRTRLRDGDFEVGDVVLVQFDGGALVKNDSLTVQEGKVIRLAEPLGDLSLAGVLRSEVSDLIRTRVDRLYKNEVVHVTPLLRLSASGALRGFYRFRPDIPLGDALMRMGANGQGADISNIEIKRGSQTVWGNADVQAALTAGMTLAQLQLEPGDEVAVAGTTQRSWATYAQYGVPILSAILLQYLLRRR
jgi:hypothetical protein